MTQTVELPLWLLVLILLFAAVTFASHFLFPSVRWFFRRRLERVVARLNQQLERPIQPFKLARRYDMIQRLIYDPQVTQAIVDHANEHEIPENVAFEEARRYAREIVPSFSASAYFGFAIRAAKMFSNALYRVRLGYFDEDALKAVDPDATVVFVMNHRSNVDYVLVTHLASDRSALSYAVGEWARVWPLSRLIRAMGAYFIRRKSRNELYRKVLARYVRLATDAGVTQAMFPEGGLSQTGALMPPKLGLLKYITDGFDPNQHDVVFVPVALNYDRVLEDQVLIAASQDPEGRFRAGIWQVTGSSLRLIWLRLTGRYHRFGYAAVSFGTPLSLRDHLRDHLQSDKDGGTETLALNLMQQIGQIVPILPVPLVAWILQKHGALSEDKLGQIAADLMDDLPHAHIHIPRDSQTYAVKVGLRNLVERGIVTQNGDVFTPVAAFATTMQYYANSIRHLMPGYDPDNAAAASEISAPART